MCGPCSSISSVIVCVCVCVCACVCVVLVHAGGAVYSPAITDFTFMVKVREYQAYFFEQ